MALANNCAQNQRKSGRGGGRGGSRADTRAPYTPWEEPKKQNEQFEKFYDSLPLIVDAEEREKFWAAMRRELPNSWRFTGSKGHDSKAMFRWLENSLTFVVVMP